MGTVPRRSRPSAPVSPARAVVSLDRLRVERAVARRSRYRYVQPRVLADGAGFRIVSPNCSRTVVADGGEIDIALLQPLVQGWMLLARDHGRGEWVTVSQGTLSGLLTLLAADPSRLFWP